MKTSAKYLPSNSLGPGPDEVGQGGLKVLHLHSQKVRTPQAESVFTVQTRRLASFEPLDSSLPPLATKLCTLKATCDPVSFSRKSLKLARCQGVNPEKFIQIN